MSLTLPEYKATNGQTWRNGWLDAVQLCVAAGSPGRGNKWPGMAQWMRLL